MKRTLNKKLICTPTSPLSISPRVRTAKMHSPTRAALHMPQTSPETPVVSAFHNPWPPDEPHGLKGDERSSEYFLVPSKNCWAALSF